MFFEEIRRMSCGDFLDIEPSCDVLNCIAEGNSCIITIDEKYFRDIGLCEYPSLLFCVKFKFFSCDFSRVYANTLPYWFFHRFDNPLCFCRRKTKYILNIIGKTRHVWIVIIFSILHSNSLRYNSDKPLHDFILWCNF